MGMQDTSSLSGNRPRSPSGWLSTLSYRSRATSPLSESDLDSLVRNAQRRNQAASVTGMVIYDEGRFMQWLEGPSQSLAEIVASINRDERHTDIEVLGNQPTPVRMFEGWDLKLARKGEVPTKWASVAEPHHTTSPSSIVGSADHLETGLVSRIAHGLLADKLNDVERSIRSAVSRMPVSTVFQNIVEPVARALGDLEAIDHCTEFDVTMGLVGLQTSLRIALQCTATDSVLQPLKVMSVPLPGEQHMLSSVLNSEVLWRAGWSVRCEFPDTLRELTEMLAYEAFDALDVSFSPAMERRSRLPILAETVAAARRASKNRSLAIVASGRTAQSAPGSLRDCGVDTSIASAATVEALVKNAIGRRVAAH